MFLTWIFKNFLNYINFLWVFNLQHKYNVEPNPYFLCIKLAKPNLYLYKYQAEIYLARNQS